MNKNWLLLAFLSSLPIQTYTAESGLTLSTLSNIVNYSSDTAAGYSSDFADDLFGDLLAKSSDQEDNVSCVSSEEDTFAELLIFDNPLFEYRNFAIEGYNTDHDLRDELAFESMIFGNDKEEVYSCFADLERYNAQYFVLRDNKYKDQNGKGRVIGVLIYIFEKDAVIHIKEITIHNCYQFMNLGTVMIQLLENKFPDTVINLCPNDDAITFYKKIGYKLLDTPDGEEIKMEKRTPSHPHNLLAKAYKAKTIYGHLTKQLPFDDKSLLEGNHSVRHELYNKTVKQIRKDLAKERKTTKPKRTVKDRERE